MKYAHLQPVLKRITRKDPKTGKIITFTKRVWVRPLTITETEKQLIQEKEEVQPTLTTEIVQERLEPFLSRLSAYAWKFKKKFPIFDIEDLKQQAILGAIEAIHKNPMLRTEKSLSKPIIAYAFKKLREFIQDNAETMGVVYSYDKKLEKGKRYTKVADILPLINSESDDEDERFIGRKLEQEIYNTLTYTEKEDTSFPYVATFYAIAKKFLSPAELLAYKRVKIENLSLRAVGDELNISHVGVKKMVSRAETKLRRVFAKLSRVNAYNISPTQISSYKYEYTSLPETQRNKIKDVNQYILFKETGIDLSDINKYLILKESDVYFLYTRDKMDLISIYDSNYNNYIRCGNI